MEVNNSNFYNNFKILTGKVIDFGNLNFLPENENLVGFSLKSHTREIKYSTGFYFFLLYFFTDDYLTF